MTTEAGVSHRGESPLVEGGVSRPRRPPDVPPPDRPTGPAPAKDLARAALPPPQVLAAAAVVVLSVELLLWQAAPLRVALLVHVALAVLAAVYAAIAWAWRRRRDRRAASGRPAPGRPGTTGVRPTAPRPATSGGSGGGLLGRLRDRIAGARPRGTSGGPGRPGAGGVRSGTPSTAKPPTGRPAGTPVGGGRPAPSKGGGLLSRLGRAVQGKTAAASGRPGTTGGPARPTPTGGGSGVRPPGTRPTGGRLGRVASALKRAGSLGRSGGSGTPRPGSSGAGAGTTPSRPRPAGGSRPRRGPLSAAAGFLRGRTDSAGGPAATTRNAPGRGVPASGVRSALGGFVKGFRDRVKQSSKNTDSPGVDDGQPAKPAGKTAPAHDPQHLRRPDQQATQELIKQEVKKATKTVPRRHGPAIHEPRHSPKIHQPQHAQGGTGMGDASRIKAAADELQSALKEYDPGAMRQLLRDMPGIGEALGGIGAGVKRIAARAEEEWPAAAPIVEALNSMGNDIKAAGDTADVGHQMRKHHETDIERHDAPRGGSKASEARWDVTTDEG